MDKLRNIDDIDERIDSFRKKEQENKVVQPPIRLSAKAARAIMVIVEFVSGPLVGGAIGYVLDILFSSKPALMIIMLFFGMLAGMLNVYRYAKSGR